MDRGEYIISDQSFGKQDGILIVIAFPCHESDQRILAQTELSARGRSTVRNHLSLFHLFARKDNRFLVVAVGLVASLEFKEVVFVLLSIGILDHNTLGINETDGSRVPCNHTDAGVHGRLGFHSRTNHRCLRGQKRNCLPLHIGAHQRTVGIVIFQEGNQRRRYREDHSRRYVHIFDDRLRIFGSFIQITARHVVALEMPLRIQGGICLRHVVIVLFVRRHIGDLIRDLRICRVAHIHTTVRRLNESVFIDPCIAGQ